MVIHNPRSNDLGIRITLSAEREIDISLPNNQRQYRALQMQKDVLPYTLC